MARSSLTVTVSARMPKSTKARIWLGNHLARYAPYLALWIVRRLRWEFKVGNRDWESRYFDVERQ